MLYLKYYDLRKFLTLFSSFNFEDKQVAVIKDILMEDPFFEYLQQEQQLLESGEGHSFLPFAESNPDFQFSDNDDFKKFD